MVPAKLAMDIIEEVTGRRTDNGIFKRWADQGRIRRFPIHAKCALYDEEEIREAAKSFGRPRATLGKPTGISMVKFPSSLCSVESNT